MNTTVTTPPQEVLRLDIRARGLRATAARIAVLGLLRRSVRALSHSEVVTALQAGAWDPTTHYRNLLALTEVGLVHRTELGDRVWRYEANAHHRSNEHPHFVCTECGKVECLSAALVTLRRPRHGPRAVHDRRVEIQLRGRCDECEAK